MIDVILALIVISMPFVAGYLCLAYPFLVLTDWHRRSWTGLGLWILTVACVVGWGVASNSSMDAADASGGGGDGLYGYGWLVSACLAALGAAVTMSRAYQRMVGRAPKGSEPIATSPDDMRPRV